MTYRIAFLRLQAIALIASMLLAKSYVFADEGWSLSLHVSSTMPEPESPLFVRIQLKNVSTAPLNQHRHMSSDTNVILETQMDATAKSWLRIALSSDIGLRMSVPPLQPIIVQPGKGPELITYFFPRTKAEDDRSDSSWQLRANTWATGHPLVSESVAMAMRRTRATHSQLSAREYVEELMEKFTNKPDERRTKLISAEHLQVIRKGTNSPTAMRALSLYDSHCATRMFAAEMDAAKAFSAMEKCLTLMPDIERAYWAEQIAAFHAVRAENRFDKLDFKRDEVEYHLAVVDNLQPYLAKESYKANWSRANKRWIEKRLNEFIGDKALREAMPH